MRTHNTESDANTPLDSGCKALKGQHLTLLQGLRLEPGDLIKSTLGLFFFLKINLLMQRLQERGIGRGRLKAAGDGAGGAPPNTRAWEGV